MFIHRENVLKAWCNIYHIVLYKESTLEKQYVNRKSDQNIHQDTYELHIFSKFSRRVTCPYMCAPDISI